MTDAEIYLRAAKIVDAAGWGHCYYRSFAREDGGYPNTSFFDQRAAIKRFWSWTRGGDFEDNEHRIIALLFAHEMAKDGQL